MSPNKHRLREPRGKYVRVSEKTRKMGERTISKSKPKVRNVDSNEEDSDFECYDKSDGKPPHVHIDKDVTEGTKRTLPLLLNRSEEDEINNIGETRDGGGNISLRRSNRIIKLHQQLGSVPYYKT